MEKSIDISKFEKIFEKIEKRKQKHLDQLREYLNKNQEKINKLISSIIKNKIQIDDESLGYFPEQTISYFKNDIEDLTKEDLLKFFDIMFSNEIFPVDQIIQENYDEELDDYETNSIIKKNLELTFVVGQGAIRIIKSYETKN